MFYCESRVLDILFTIIFSSWFIYHIVGLCFAVNIIMLIKTLAVKSKKLKLFPIVLIYTWAASITGMILSSSGWLGESAPSFLPCSHIEYGAFFFTHLAALAVALYLIVFSRFKLRLQGVLLFTSFLPVSFEILLLQWQMKSPAGELVLSFLRIQLFAFAAWGILHYCRFFAVEAFRKRKGFTQKKVLASLFRIIPGVLLFTAAGALFIPLFFCLKSYDNYIFLKQFFKDVTFYNQTAVAVKHLLFLSDPLHPGDELVMLMKREHTFNTRPWPILVCPACSGSFAAQGSDCFYKQLRDENTLFLHLTYSRKKLLDEFDGLTSANTEDSFQAGRSWDVHVHRCPFDVHSKLYSISYSINEHFISLPNFYKLVKDNDVYHIAIVMSEDPDIHSGSELFPVYLNVWKNRKLYARCKLYESEDPLHTDIRSFIRKDGIVHLDLKRIKKQIKINIFTMNNSTLNVHKSTPKNTPEK